jgi:hypothetical protein
MPTKDRTDEPTLARRATPRKRGPSTLLVVLLASGGLLAVSMALGIAALVIAPALPRTPPIPATEMVAVYESNPVDGDARYRDRTVRVSGTVRQVGGFKNAAWFNLDAGRGRTVRCSFGSLGSSRVADVRVGDTVTVSGKGGGFLADTAYINDCLLSDW